MADDITVAELFAGVGGFRLGLEGAPSKEWETDLLKVEDTGFKVVYSNQWEPPGAKAASKSKKKRKGTKRRCNALTLKGQQCKKEEYGVPEGGFCKLHRDMHREGAQWASDIYEARFGPEGHSNENINDIAFNEGTMVETIREKVPEHDLLVGGFPCQDYSVARTKSGELGIKGEKGKLWIPIRNIIREMRPRPKVVLLENVPRLLNSPANARGLNFAIILNDLIRLGYEVEWRVINAADYGMPQQRSRVFVMAYRKPGSSSRKLSINKNGNFGALKKSLGPMNKWLLNKSTNNNSPKWEVGPFAEAFPVTGNLPSKHEIIPPLDYPFNSKKTPFGNIGYAWNCRFRGQSPKTQEFRFWTTKVKADYDGERQTIRDIMVSKGEGGYDDSYEVDEADLQGWEYAKADKKEFRIRKADKERWPDLWKTYRKCIESQDQSVWDEHRQEFIDTLGDDGSYKYEEGQIAYPDSIDKPSRTVVTAEIGRSASRMRHLIKHDDGTYRTLFSIETERLNMFPDNWTKIEVNGKEIAASKRGFLMGNALVVGVIQPLRDPIRDLILRRL